MYKLQEFRLTTGLSQDDMARKLGVSVSMYQKVEREAANPSIRFMEKLKQAYPHASIYIIFFSDIKSNPSKDKSRKKIPFGKKKAKASEE